MALQQLRSSTANKRPTAGAMSDGQLAVNTNATNPGLFFKDADGSVRKIGPVFIGSAAPNASPATGGSTGHSVGEQWLDNSGGTYVLKIWDGTAWRSESGTFVDVSGDNMTGNLTLGTDKVVLDATSGAATLQGAIKTRQDSNSALAFAVTQGGTANGDATIRFDGDGSATFASNVGIGTTSPDGMLTVQSDTGNSQVYIKTNNTTSRSQLIFGDSADSNVGGIAYYHTDDSMQFNVGNLGEKMRIDSSGRLLIGATSGTELLEVHGDTPVLKLRDTSDYVAGTGPQIYFQGKDSNEAIKNFAIIRGQANGADNGELTFWTRLNGSSIERLRIKNNGNVGIGTTSPTALLHVKASGDTDAASGSGSVRIQGGASSYSGYIGFDADKMSFGTNNSSRGLSLVAGGSERMRMRSDGKVLIGTTASQDSTALLQVYKSSGSTTVWCESDALSNGQYSMFRAVGEASGTTNSRQAWIGVHKHSGITNACGFIFMDAQNSNNNYYWTDDSNNLRRTSSASNIGTTNGTVVGTQTSDERLKNVGDNVSYGLTEVLQLQPKQYALKSEPDVNKLGFIAQEVESVIPEAVFDTKEELEGHQEGDRTKLGMEYVQLIPVLVNAIKEQQTTIADLQSRLAALEAG